MFRYGWDRKKGEPKKTGLITIVDQIIKIGQKVLPTTLQVGDYE